MNEVLSTETARLSQAQVLDAIGSMSADNKTRINLIARSHAKAMFDYGSYQDLISAASVRALDGRRAWIRGQPVVSFYFATMRSIAYEWRKRALTDGKVGYELSEEMPDEETEAEEQRLHEMKIRALAAFDDDPVARKIVLGMMDGLRGEELRRLSGLDPTGFASKQKKVDRRLRKFMGSMRS